MDTARSPDPNSGVVRIRPALEYDCVAPDGERRLTGVDWAIPGQWTLARVEDQKSTVSRSWWTDLPYSLGLISPAFVDCESFEIAGSQSARWHAELLAAALQRRESVPVTIRVHRRRRERRGCLFNCLNSYFGDAASLLLRVGRVDAGEYDVIALVPRNLEWMIPDSVSEAWVVDAPLSSFATWNSSLAERVRQLVMERDECFVPTVFELPSLTRNDLEQFTRVRPFRLDEWVERLSHKPIISFFWRDDRCWTGADCGRRLLSGRLSRIPCAASLNQLVRSAASVTARSEQFRRVSELAVRVKAMLPSAELRVLGLGRQGKVPGGVVDLRITNPTPAGESEMCRLAAESHVLVGVHGSHMLLPSGHAGATIELLPRDRLRNAFQDLVIPAGEEDSAYRSRLLPVETSARTVAETVVSIVLNAPAARRFVPSATPNRERLSCAAVEAIRAEEQTRQQTIARMLSPGAIGFVGP